MTVRLDGRRLKVAIAHLAYEGGNNYGKNRYEQD